MAATALKAQLAKEEYMAGVRQEWQGGRRGSSCRTGSGEGVTNHLENKHDGFSVSSGNSRAAYPNHPLYITNARI